MASTEIIGKWKNFDRPACEKWSEEEIKFALELDRRGETARFISKALATKFGTNRTKNSVIAKLSRLGGKSSARI